MARASKATPARKTRSSTAGATTRSRRQSAASRKSASPRKSATTTNAKSPRSKTGPKTGGELWEITEIIGERDDMYQVQWAGTNSRTGKPWAPSWVSKEGVSAEELVQKWEEQNKKPAPRKSASSARRRSGRRWFAGAMHALRRVRDLKCHQRWFPKVHGYDIVLACSGSETINQPISDTPRSDAFDLPLESLPLPLDLTSEIVKQDIALEIGRVEKVYRGVWTTKGIPVAIKYVEAVKRKVDDERGNAHAHALIFIDITRNTKAPYANQYLVIVAVLYSRFEDYGDAEDLSQAIASPSAVLNHHPILDCFERCRAGFRLTIQTFYPCTASPTILKELMAEVACGLAHLHEKGIVHGDIRAGKVLVTHCRDESLGTYKLRALICDSGFGDSGALRWRAWEREAPEQFTREFRDVKKEDLEGSLADKRCDVWSWGMTVVELFSAEVPFASLNQEQVKKALLEDDLYDWWHMAARNALTLELQQILPFCFQRDPRKRPTMQDILGGLRYRQPRAATEYNDQRHKAQLPVVATSSVGYKNRYGDITLPDQPLLVTTWPNGDAKCTGYRLRFTKESGFFPADHTRLISGPPIYAEGGQRQYYLQVTRSFSGAIVTHNAVPPGHVVGVTKAPERGLWTWELERSRNRDGDEPIISSGATESVNLVTFAQA
ncbi:kinase-like protein [Punctularia strigosozonata HHB-11173 SS5]|uniref:kinase-like protein n=1 Tax=Punctularia strigosozonata (strain HHB-11173) TaxID=741275 RepID=UPI0004416319|nr:kinase-like protein [Punctularia strigosozonata HHB-11173 SS5]EIN05676.1 kinase-like protein [Punctularia strigosozonata HHB-11173 SS5]